MPACQGFEQSTAPPTYARLDVYEHKWCVRVPLEICFFARELEYCRDRLSTPPLNEDVCEEVFEPRGGLRLHAQDYRRGPLGRT